MTNAEIIFARWKEHAMEDYGTARFTKVITKEILDNLIASFKEKRIDKDSVMMFERKVVDFMVTEEGRRGGRNKKTGKDYKGWVQSVKDMYKASVGDHYDQELTDEKESFTSYMLSNELVKLWVVKRFGASQVILNEVCRESCLNLQMQEEIFNSEWSRTGEKVPDYAHGLLKEKIDEV